MSNSQSGSWHYNTATTAGSPQGRNNAWATHWLRLPALTALLLLSGCNLLAIGEQQKQTETLCALSGTLHASNASNTQLITVLMSAESTPDGQRSHLVDHFLMDASNNWHFTMLPGQYLVTAMNDLNRNGKYDPTEPAISFTDAPRFTCVGGNVASGVTLSLQPTDHVTVNEPVSLADLQARSAQAQQRLSLGQALVKGEVIALQDARFSVANAGKGLWKPYDFLWDNRPGVYFLEPYDAKKTPVLFVHGMTGHPDEFAYLIDHLDRKRFQPWVFWYPSGYPLKPLGGALSDLLLQLKAKHRFDKIHIVAHSMGGLITRSALLEQPHGDLSRTVPLFISIATPWSGHDSAKWGVTMAPTPVYSWIDMAPNSQFLTSIFYTDNERRLLPAHVNYHLLFSFLPKETGDGSIEVVSELREEAQSEASSIRGIQQSHTGILSDDRTVAVINHLLREAD